MRISDVIIRPIVTEKSMEYGAENKYSFEVNKRASKGAISNEIERIYGVDVLDVNTMIVRGKKRRILKTRRFTTTKNWKKAIIKLKEGQSIDLVAK